MVNATNFDGTNDYMLRGAELTGLVDGKVGIASAWFKINGSSGTFRRIFGNFNNVTLGILLSISSAGVVNVIGRNAGNTQILRANSTSTFDTAGGWHHILASWDLASTTVDLFIDDVEEVSGQVATNDTLDYTRGDFCVGSDIPPGAGNNKMNGCLSEVYFNSAEYLDITQAANRRKFITADLKAVNLGSDGSTPTGTAPIIYLPNPFGTFEQNAGTGGNFTVTGSLTACADAPEEEEVGADTSFTPGGFSNPSLQHYRQVIGY